jgi:2-beta-glucuronyltransferase
VYRVSDDLRLLGNHPLVIETEERIAGRFDLVSVPSPHMLRLFPGSRVSVHHHGVRGELLDAPSRSPYDARWEANLVFVGVAHLDADFIARASRIFPRYAFHIIGPLAGVPVRPNVLAYGELAYSETVRYIRHADIGLHTLTYRPGAEAFTRSLKVLQYNYCRLPIIATDFMQMDWPFVSSYRIGDDASIQRAVKLAIATDRSTITREGLHSWYDLARLLAGT